MITKETVTSNKEIVTRNDQKSNGQQAKSNK